MFCFLTNLHKFAEIINKCLIILIRNIMKARKLILSIVAVMATAFSMTAFAQAPQVKKEAAQTIDGTWNMKTVGSPVGEIEFDIVITKTEEGYKASVPGYEISNTKVTDKSFYCSTEAAGMVVDIYLDLTEKGTLEGDAMGIAIVGEKKGAKKVEEKK